MAQEKVIYPNGSSAMVPVSGEPDTCPVCHRASELKQIGDTWVRVDADGRNNHLQKLFRCPRHKCGSIFIAEFSQMHSSSYLLARFYPLFPQEPEFPEGISDISPTHCKIYIQAKRAENTGLDEIAGIGYRKSLEFLVKDYCLWEHPDRVDAIKKKPLAQCIKDDIDDSNIRECAKRAAWLGNDESHYERVWTAHDVGDLKILIKLCLQWISNAFLTQKYLKEMDPSTAPRGKSDPGITQ